MIKKLLVDIIGTYEIKPFEYQPVDVEWVCGFLALMLFIYIVFKGLMYLIKG